MDAARLLLARMGLTAESLLGTPTDRSPLSMFTAYVPLVSAKSPTEHTKTHVVSQRNAHGGRSVG